MLQVLGLSALYPDSAAVLLRDGEIVAVVQEERFTRVKNDPSFPSNAIRYLLSAMTSLTDFSATTSLTLNMVYLSL